MYVCTFFGDGFDDSNNCRLEYHGAIIRLGKQDVAIMRSHWSMALLLILVSTSLIWLAHTVYG